jgi:hypothetical protein
MAIMFKELTLLTDDISRLRVFYETVFQMEGDGGDSHIKTGSIWRLKN